MNDYMGYIWYYPHNAKNLYHLGLFHDIDIDINIDIYDMPNIGFNHDTTFPMFYHFITRLFHNGN
jgi:hypothetical protein